jgi:hypothetical protein
MDGGEDDLPRVFEISLPPRFTLSLLERSAPVSSNSDQCSARVTSTLT